MGASDPPSEGRKIAQPSVPPAPDHVSPYGEFWPVSNPPFQDDAPPPWQERIDAWRPFDCEPANTGLDDRLVRKAERTSLANGGIRRLLANKRYIAIGASLRKSTEAHAQDKNGALLFLFYNYTDDLAIEIRLDASATLVEAVSHSRSQPAATEEEVDRAILLARSDQRLAELITPDLEANALLIDNVDEYDRRAKIPYYYHRLIEVSFRRPDERGPLYQALVDLSAEAVIDTLVVNALRSAERGT